ncbi:MAG: hypothetical protein HMLKMBBP_03705 [Planctomycetes bacterium]|nr:hypothetical protein [Planctomycetota bacterium]
MLLSVAPPRTIVSFRTDHLAVAVASGTSPSVGPWVAWTEGAKGAYTVRWATVDGNGGGGDVVLRAATERFPRLAAGSLGGAPALVAYGPPSIAPTGLEGGTLARRGHDGRWTLQNPLGSEFRGPVALSSTDDDAVAYVRRIARIDLQRLWRNALLRDRDPLQGAFGKPVVAHLTEQGVVDRTLLDDGGVRETRALSFDRGVAACVMSDVRAGAPRTVWATSAEDASLSELGVAGGTPGSAAACRGPGGVPHVFYTGDRGVIVRTFADGAWSPPVEIPFRAVPARIAAADAGDAIVLVASYEPHGPIDAVAGRNGAWTRPLALGEGHSVCVSSAGTSNSVDVAWADTWPRVFTGGQTVAPDGTWAETALRTVHVTVAPR